MEDESSQKHCPKYGNENPPMAGNSSRSSQRVEQQLQS